MATTSVPSDSQHVPALPTADPLLEEIRAVKAAVSARFDHDVLKLGEHLMAVQQSNRSRLITRNGAPANRLI